MWKAVAFSLLMSHQFERENMLVYIMLGNTKYIIHYKSSVSFAISSSKIINWKAYLKKY